MPRRLLLIDDDRLQFRLTEQMVAAFHGERFELDWAATYEDGLARLLAGGYAACLLDYQLGGRDGLMLIAEAAKAGCATPIVFITAETSAGVDHAAMRAGAMDYLIKGEITPVSLERSLRYAVQLAGTLRRLGELATRDELTGLLNRREFDRLLAEEAERALRLKHPLALVLLDLDLFKEVNDARGHPAGDRVLKAVAEGLRAGVRGIDRVARIGGDEFAVILVEAGPDEAALVAGRLVRGVREKPMPAATGESFSVTASAGVATLPRDGCTPEALVQSADQALYAAKRAGGGRVGAGRG